MTQNGPVYVDVIFLVNFVMDFMAIWATGKLAGVRAVFRRTIAAAALGAIYAVGNVFPQFDSWYTFPLKVLFSAVLVLVAFWPSHWRQFFRLWGWFYGVGFAMAGAVLGSSSLFQSFPHNVVPDFSYTYLSGGVVCAIALGVYGEKLMRERLVPHVLQCPVQLRFGSVWCEGQGFVDTGNALVDPLTQKPVVIAEYGLLNGCLPGDVAAALDKNEQESDLFESLAETSWASRLRLIPFTSIGKKHGLLVGVRADELAVQAGNRWVSHAGVVVGLYRENLSPDGRFQMLLPASILEN
ncbi:MAG: sigma-E processing peptidase SpoIIGA [Acidobacteriota bacterium]